MGYSARRSSDWGYSAAARLNHHCKRGGTGYSVSPLLGVTSPLARPLRPLLRRSLVSAWPRDRLTGGVLGCGGRQGQVYGWACSYPFRRVPNLTHHGAVSKRRQLAKVRTPRSNAERHLATPHTPGATSLSPPHTAHAPRGRAADTRQALRRPRPRPRRPRASGCARSALLATRGASRPASSHRNGGKTVPGAASCASPAGNTRGSARVSRSWPTRLPTLQRRLSTCAMRKRGVAWSGAGATNGTC